MIDRAVKVSTDNTKLVPGEKTKIEVVVDYSVPENLPEAIECYGGEEKLVQSIQADFGRRKANAARPVLRDSAVELDWEQVAFDTGEAYVPGRKGGFGRVSVSEDELAGLGDDFDVEKLKALLASKGATITS